MELFWIPVGAGTSGLQRASLALWEVVEAARASRPRSTLYHSALKLRLAGTISTLELMPAFVRTPSPALLTGPVGARLAGRLSLFRYQVAQLEKECLPDEQWAVESPQLLSTEEDMARNILALACRAPAYTWGRRVRGTSEMWTSDSVVSWLLMQAGADFSRVHVPGGGRAPGWPAGIEVARRDARPR